MKIRKLISILVLVTFGFQQTSFADILPKHAHSSLAVNAGTHDEISTGGELTADDLHRAAAELGHAAPPLTPAGITRLADLIAEEPVEVDYQNPALHDPLYTTNLKPDDIILVSMAAGRGTRFGGEVHKSAAPLGGKPLAQHNVDTARNLGFRHAILIVGDRKEQVKAALEGVDAFVTQPNPVSGTANAAMQAAKIPGLLGGEGLLFIVPGDLAIRPDVMAEFLKTHQESGNAITILTHETTPESSAGVIVRDAAGNVDSIVEVRDLRRLAELGENYRLRDGTEVPPQQLLSRTERNRSTYIIPVRLLDELLGGVTNDNEQHQFYLTDIARAAAARGLRVGTFKTEREAVLGVNTQGELAYAEEVVARDERWRAWSKGFVSDDEKRVADRQAHDYVRRAFDEGRAFAISGLGSGSIPQLVDEYSRRRPLPLSPENREALIRRLERIAAFITHTIQNNPNVQDEAIRQRLLGSTRLVVILDEEGKPVIFEQGEPGTPQHKYLVSFGGYRSGRPTLAALPSVYMSLDLIEGFMFEEDGADAFAIKISHEDSDLDRGHHVDEPAERARLVDNVIERVILKREVEDAARRWFGPNSTRADEVELERFLTERGEEAIRHFVRLIEEDRGESIGPWQIPAKDWSDPETLRKLPKPGSLLCVSVERKEGRPIPYYMPKTLEAAKEMFEKERMKRMAQVAIQRALGRKIVVDVGIGFVGTAELLVGCSTQKNIPARTYSRPLLYRAPLSGEGQHPVFAKGYEPLGKGSYRQYMMDRGLVGLRADDPAVKPTAAEGYQRGNLAATFLPEIIAVSDFSLLSIPQHPNKTLLGHPENIFADPKEGLEVIKTVARLIPPNAACIVESTVFPLYMELFAIPTFEEELAKRRIPDEEKPSLCYSFQRMAPGVRWLRSNREQVRMGGATTEKGRRALAEYFELIGYRYSVSDKIVAAENTKDSENAIRYQFIAATAPMQAIFEALGLDIYKTTHEIIGAMVKESVPEPDRQALLMESVVSLKSAYERALDYAEGIENPQERETFRQQVVSVFGQSTAAIFNQAVLFPGGYCVIEQIGHLIYGMVATGLATELDIKVIFQPALATIAYMHMRQQDLADWISAGLAERGIDPRDASVWCGGVTYMPQIEDARNGAAEYLVRSLADMGVTDFTVFEPYASRWDQVQRQDAFSPECTGCGLTRQTWLRGTNYIFGQRLSERGETAVEDKYEHIDPHTSFSPEQDVVVLAMDHPQLVGKNQPALRRTDGTGKLHPGLDAVKVSARMMAREGKIIVDTHDFLADEDIKEFLALGWEVRALGRGHIERLREEVARDIDFQRSVTQRLLGELEALSQEQRGFDPRLVMAIKTARAKSDYLNADFSTREYRRRKWLEAQEVQEKAYAKRINPDRTGAVLERLVSSELEPAVDKLQANVEELRTLATALASQIAKERCVRPRDAGEMLRHIQRLTYLRGLLQDLLSDCNLAANELFTSKGKAAILSDPRVRGIISPYPQAGEAGPRLAVSEEEAAGLLVQASRTQHQGINTSFQRASESIGTQMGTKEQAGSMANLILHDRPDTHSPVAEQPGVSPDPELMSASGRLLDLYRQTGVSPLDARTQTFSYEANAERLKDTPERTAQMILAELAGIGIAPETARIYLSGRVGDMALQQEEAAVREMNESLRAAGCRDVTVPFDSGEFPTAVVTPEQNVVVLTDSSGLTRDMDAVELAARAMAREGNLIFDATNALTSEQVMGLLALDWHVAGTGRSDIYGRDVIDIRGNRQHLAGLIDDVTDQMRLEITGRLLERLRSLRGDGSINQARLEDAIATTVAKIDYLKARIKTIESPHDTELVRTADRLRILYERARQTQEAIYSLPLQARNKEEALEKVTENITMPLERELADLLGSSARASVVLAEQLGAGRCRRPETPGDFHAQLRRVQYLTHIFDDVAVDAARAGDVLFGEEGQLGVRDELDRLKREERGERLVLPQPRTPQYFQAQLRSAPMPPDIIDREKVRLAEARGIAKESISAEEAIASLHERFYGRFAEAGDVRLLPALKIHPGPDGRQVQITVDPEGELAFYSLRCLGDAARSKHDNSVDWVKYNVLVPLYIVDARPEITGETTPRVFDYFLTQELLRSSLPWETKQWLVREVLSKGKVLTTIRAEGAEPQDRIAVLMQGNPYADVGASRGAGGSGRSGFFVSVEGEQPEVIVTRDEYGRERLIENKGCGPAFGERTQELIYSMQRTIAGGQWRDAQGRMRVGQTTLAQLFGLVRGPQVDALLKLQGQPMHKEEGATAGIAGAVFHSLPWDRPDVLVGQVWRTSSSNWRLGFQFKGDKSDFDPEALAYEMGFAAAEILAHFGDSANVHIALGLDNIRRTGVKMRPRTTKEGEEEAAEPVEPAREAIKGYPTDEDSLVNVADERNVFDAFDFYFGWTLAFALHEYKDAKSGRLENPDYKYFPQFIDGFIGHLIEAPLIRHNPLAVQRLEAIRASSRQVKKPEQFAAVVESLKKELRTSYIPYRALRLRIENGYNPKADSVYTSNVGRNFRRGRLTAKGPSRLIRKGDREEMKPSARYEALEFLDAESTLLDLAERTMSEGETGGYPRLRFNFEVARKEIAEKRKTIERVAAEERRIVTQLFQVMGWGNIDEGTGYFAQAADALALGALYEQAYRMLIAAGEAVPGLEILEKLPSYEEVYELSYYAPRSELKYAKVAEADTFRGGAAPMRLGEATVQASGLWDKALAQKSIAKAEMAEGRQMVSVTEGETALGLETFEAAGAKGPMRTLVRRNPNSRKVVMYHHGLGGTAADHVAAWISEGINDKASLVTFTSSRLSPIMHGEEINPDVMDRVFGQKGTEQAKTFAQEADDLRSVIGGTVQYFKAQGVPEDELEIILVGRSMGGQVASQVASEFPQVKTLMMLASSLETVSASGLRPEQWHPLSIMPDKHAILANFNAFGGRKIFVEAAGDSAQRNASIEEWYRRAGGNVEMFKLVDDHTMRAPPSRERLKALIAGAVGDDWQLQRPQETPARREPTGAFRIVKIESEPTGVAGDEHDVIADVIRNMLTHSEGSGAYAVVTNGEDMGTVTLNPGAQAEFAPLLATLTGRIGNPNANIIIIPGLERACEEREVSGIVSHEGHGLVTDGRNIYIDADRFRDLMMYGTEEEQLEFLIHLVKHLDSRRQPNETGQAYEDRIEEIAPTARVRARFAEIDRMKTLPAKHRTMAEWRDAFANPSQRGLTAWLKTNYGEDEARTAERTKNALALLGNREAQETELFDESRPVVLGRTPSRIRAKGGHTDMPGNGGYLVNMAGEMEMMYIGQARADNQVILMNTDPRYEPAAFSLDDWDLNPPTGVSTVAEWSEWCASVEIRKKREFRESLNAQRAAEGQPPVSDEEFKEKWAVAKDKNWHEYFKGMIAFLRTDLGDPTGEIRKKLTGFSLLLDSEIPKAGGLSSSSSLVMTAGLVLSDVLYLGLSSGQIVDLGYCEYYNGTRGGKSDHAAIVLGKLGEVSLMRSLPEEVVESVPMPKGVSLFMVDSKIRRGQAPQVSGKLKREGITDHQEILKRTGASYLFVPLLLRAQLQRFIATRPNDPKAERYRQYLEALTPTHTNPGLMREFNRGGEIDFSTEEERTKTIFEMLKLIPVRVTRQMLRDAIFTLYPGDENEANREYGLRSLESLFGTHREPAGGYNLRGYALYGWAESERCVEYAECARRGDIDGMLRLAEIAQDGDRASKNGEPYLEYDTITDQAIDSWIAEPAKNPVWSKAGWFERSIEPIDELCDEINRRFGKGAAARISGAGLGGVLGLHVRDEIAEDVIHFLEERGYVRGRDIIGPCKPAQGASIVATITPKIEFATAESALVKTRVPMQLLEQDENAQAFTDLLEGQKDAKLPKDKVGLIVSAKFVLENIGSREVIEKLIARGFVIAVNAETEEEFNAMEHMNIRGIELAAPFEGLRRKERLERLVARLQLKGVKVRENIGLIENPQDNVEEAIQELTDIAPDIYVGVPETAKPDELISVHGVFHDVIEAIAAQRRDKIFAIQLPPVKSPSDEMQRAYFEYREATTFLKKA